MRLIVTIILGISFAYTLSCEAPAKTREIFSPQNTLTETVADNACVSIAADVSEQDYETVPVIAADTSYCHSVSKSWWKSRFSYLNTK